MALDHILQVKKTSKSVINQIFTDLDNSFVTDVINCNGNDNILTFLAGTEIEKLFLLFGLKRNKKIQIRTDDIFCNIHVLLIV